MKQMYRCHSGKKSIAFQHGRLIHEMSNYLPSVWIKQNLDFFHGVRSSTPRKTLVKLKCLGIKGFLLAWFRSYSSGRRHRVVIDNEASDFLLFTSEVLQGSILRSLLFLIYVNDMLSVISGDTSLKLYCFSLSSFIFLSSSVHLL